MLSYFKNNPQLPHSAGQSESNPPPNVGVTTSVEATYSTEAFQEKGSVSSVDSDGGHFSISNVGFGAYSGTLSANPSILMVTLSPNQLSLLSFGEDVEVSLRYIPTQQSMFDGLGKVTLVTTSADCSPTSPTYVPQPCAEIGLVNPNMPTTIPVNWNPKIGDEVILSISEEGGTPLVAITGVQSQAWTSQFSAVVNSPSCLVSPPCVMTANSPPVVVNMTLYYYCNYSCPVSVTTSDSGYTISDFQQSTSLVGQNVSFVVTITDSNFSGDLHLTFASTSS